MDLPHVETRYCHTGTDTIRLIQFILGATFKFLRIARQNYVALLGHSM
jgi:hypothetical protein